MFLFPDLLLNEGGNLAGELNDVHLVRDGSVGLMNVAVKKDLFDVVVSHLFHLIQLRIEVLAITLCGPDLYRLNSLFRNSLITKSLDDLSSWSSASSAESNSFPSSVINAVISLICICSLLARSLEERRTSPIPF